MFVVILSGINSGGFLILGLSMLKSEPAQFICKNEDGNGTYSCTKHAICSSNLSMDDYYPDASDS